MRYKLIAGRTITRDGAPFVVCNKADETVPPSDADLCAQYVTHALNLNVTTRTLGLLTSAPVTWQDATFPHERQCDNVVADLDVLLQRAALLRAYLTHRYTYGDGHARAVTASNALANKVRRLLGYTYPSTVAF